MAIFTIISKHNISSSQKKFSIFGEKKEATNWVDSVFGVFFAGASLTYLAIREKAIQDNTINDQ